MRISVIIPTYNEAKNIGSLIESLQINGKEHLAEIIVSDSPNSTDDTISVAKKYNAIGVTSLRKGRGFQMNYGATFATGDILYFIHADTKINPDFVSDILQAVSEGFDLGCYRYIFDSNNLLLKINAYFTRFDKIWCRGGDQTLFVTKSAFDKLEGYRSDFLIMEDYDFILRARKFFKFKIIPKNVIVSARKYETNSYFRVQLANFKVMKMFLSQNYSQKEMAEAYQKMLNYR
ncbi:MAG: TIGR04283 family arsenosugar biosynthesis glycosyltransferase [Spirosomaceae bacterium]|nr:TIGR04283 family arsenosugar biosynthesis glycosyltransferase [Spirosomataceae bacterium]